MPEGKTTRKQICELILMQIPHEFHSFMNLLALKSLWKPLDPGFIWQIVVNTSWISIFLSASLLSTNIITDFLSFGIWKMYLSLLFLEKYFDTVSRLWGLLFKLKSGLRNTRIPINYQCATSAWGPEAAPSLRQHHCAGGVLSPAQGPGGAGGIRGELRGRLGLGLGPARGGPCWGVGAGGTPGCLQPQPARDSVNLFTRSLVLTDFQQQTRAGPY